jgi:hypothetical protein
MRSTWPAALLALALLTGCGSNSNGSPQAAPPAPGPATTAPSGAKASGAVQCPENSVIADTLGITVTRNDAPARFGDKSIACGYNGTKAGDKLTSVTLRLQTDGSHSDYANFKDQTTAQHYTATDRSGVGDEAFTYPVTNTADPLNALVARKGGVFVYVAAQVSYDQLIALFNKLAA